MMIGIVLFLFLAEHSPRMNEKTIIVCINAPPGLGIGEAVTTIEGVGENITKWTERTTIDRDEFNEVFQLLRGIIPTEEDIRNWFDGPENDLGMQGVSWVLISVDDDTIVIDYIFNYMEMSERDLNTIWTTDNFSCEVTLTFAIAHLEYRNAICKID